MADEIGGMLLNDISPQIAALGNVPRSVNQGQADALSLENAKMENRKGQIGLDEMEKTSPDRVAKSYFDTVQNINTPDGEVLGAKPQQGKPMGYDIQDIDAEMNRRYPTPEAQAKFHAMSPEEHAKVIMDVQKTVAAGMSDEHFTPIGHSTGVIGLDKDGNLIHHQTDATIDMDNPASKKALYNRAANLGVESDATIEQRQAQAKIEAAQARVETSAEGKLNVQKEKNKGNIENTDEKAKVGLGKGGTSQDKLDRDAVATMQKLLKPNVYGQVPADNKRRAAEILTQIQGAHWKGIANAAYGTNVMSGGPPMNPVASQPQSAAPQPVMVQVYNSNGVPGKIPLSPGQRLPPGYRERK